MFNDRIELVHLRSAKHNIVQAYPGQTQPGQLFAGETLEETLNFLVNFRSTKTVKTT